MSLVRDPVPFRIRVGVLGLPGAAGALAGSARPDIARRFLEVVQEEVPALLDEASRARLKRAQTTEVAFAIVSAAGDEVAGRLLDELALPASIRRDVPPARAGETRSPEERLVDECDVVLVLSGDPLSESEARGNSGRELAYAELRTRPVIALALRDRSTLVVDRDGIDARSISRIDRYNRANPSEETAEAYAANEIRDLFGPYPEGHELHGRPHPGEGVPEANRRLVVEHLVPHYVKASTLSKAAQRAYTWTALLVYVFAVVAVALVAFGALVHEFAAIAFALEFGVLLAIVLLITIADRRRTHSRWLETRFLTERIRHAMYLVACGVHPADHRIPPHVGGREAPDLWMLNVFEEVRSALPERLTSCDDESCPLLSDFVREVWVGEQLRYHRRKRRRLHRWNRILEGAGVWMFGFAILAAASHLVLLAAHALHLEWPTPTWLEGGITWVALVLPAAGASIGGFRAHREFSRLSKRSAAMAHALEDMEARLERVTDSTDLEAMLGQIEGWMVEEAQGWLMLMGPLKLEAT